MNITLTTKELASCVEAVILQDAGNDFGEGVHDVVFDLVHVAHIITGAAPKAELVEAIKMTIGWMTPEEKPEQMSLYLESLNSDAVEEAFGLQASEL